MEYPWGCALACHWLCGSGARERICNWKHIFGSYEHKNSSQNLGMGKVTLIQHNVQREESWQQKSRKNCHSRDDWEASRETRRVSLGTVSRNLVWTRVGKKCTKLWMELLNILDEGNEGVEGGESESQVSSLREQLAGQEKEEDVRF